MSGGEERVPKGYKQTEVGVIPEDWRCESLNEHARIIHGYGFKSVYFTALSDFHLTTPGNFYEIGGFRKLEEKQKFYDGPIPNGYILQAANLIIAMTEQADGLLGSAALVPSDNTYLHNQRLGLVKTKSNAISISYLYRIFNSKPYRQKVRETAAGTKVKHTSPQKLLEIMAIFPSIVEQDAITKSLSNSDSQIQSLENLIAKKRDIKHGTIQELLTGKTRLPGFNEEWEFKSIGEIAQVIGGGTPSTQVSNYWGGGINWFTPTEVGSTKYLSKSVRKLTDSGLQNSSASLLPMGAILLTSRAGIGDLGILNAIACTNQGFQSLVCNDKVNNEFLYYVMLTKRPELERRSSGSTFLEINPREVNSLLIPLPRINEQEAIVEVLSDMDAEITALEQRLEKAKAIKQGMMQQLLTGRIRLVEPSKPVEANA